jgi:predicted dehydrogenase
MLRVGVVGCGGVGLRHAQAYQSHPESELVAVCDLVQEKADERAALLGVKAYTSLKDMLAHEELDVVGVIVADNLHFEPTLEALEAGKHVLVEKPLCLIIDEARRLVAKAQEKGVQLAVNYNRRFSPCYFRAKQALVDGSLGDVAYVMLKLSQGGPYGTSKAPYYHLYELQVHAFDLMRHFGGEVEELFCELGDVRGTGIYCSAAITFKFTNGAVGTMIGSWDSSFNHPIEYMEVCGTKAYAVVEDIVSEFRLHRHDQRDTIVWRPTIFDERGRFDSTFGAHVHAFVDALAAGKPAPVTGLDGLRCLEVIEGCIRSFETKQPVKPY